MATIDDVYTLLSSLNTFVNGQLAGDASSAANTGTRLLNMMGWSYGEWDTHTLNSDVARIIAAVTDANTALGNLGVAVANLLDALNAIDFSPLAAIGTDADSYEAGQHTVFGVLDDVFAE